MLAVSLALLVAAQAVSAASEAPALPVPDVPFVAQPKSLCGGAALAMVLRYWGAHDATAEEFAVGLTADGRGLSPEALAGFAVARGYRAFRFRGEPGPVRAQLDRGRPVIALRAAEAGRYHYVVLLAWRAGFVLLHDPSEGPFRVVGEAEWLRASGDADGWAVLVLPAPTPPGPEPVGDVLDPRDACSSAIAAAATSASTFDLSGAERALDEAPLACEQASPIWRERAGVAFRREDWPRAVELASRALALDPGDVDARRLLATSLYLADDRDHALEAWNALGEPRVSGLSLDGLVASRYREVHELVGVRPGTLLSVPALERAQRRLRDLPAVQAARVSYRPDGKGAAQVEAHVLERPRFPSPSRLLLDSGLRSLDSGAPAGSAQLLLAGGTALQLEFAWREARSELRLSASAPGALGLPGLVTTEMAFDEQTYALAGSSLRERHRGAALAFGHWWTGRLRSDLRVAYGEWSGSGSHLSLGLGVDRRAFTNRLALRASAEGFLPLQGNAAFLASSLQVSARTSASPTPLAARADFSYDSVPARAPRGLWPGAGTGSGRSRLLRAHPLLNQGVVSGPAFGQALLRAGLEGEARVASLAGVRFSVALFADFVSVRNSEQRARSFADLGSGLRIRLPGGQTTLRLDAAVPASGGPLHVSLGVTRAWPD